MHYLENESSHLEINTQDPHMTLTNDNSNDMNYIDQNPNLHSRSSHEALNHYISICKVFTI